MFIQLQMDIENLYGLKIFRIKRLSSIVEDHLNFPFSVLMNMDKALENSTLGKVAYHLRIERFQTDPIKFERTQIHVFSHVFTAFVVAVA